MTVCKIQQNHGNSEINLQGVTVRGLFRDAYEFDVFLYLGNGLMHTG